MPVSKPWQRSTRKRESNPFFFFFPQNTPIRSPHASPPLFMMIKKLLIEALKIAIIAWLVLSLIHLININPMLGFSILAIFIFLGIVLDILLRHGRETMKIKSSIQETKNIDSMPPNNIDNFKSPLQKSGTIKPQQNNLNLPLLQEQNNNSMTIEKTTIEEVLGFLNTMILVINIVAGVILIATETITGPFIVAVIVSWFITFFFWALVKVVIKILKNVEEINNNINNESRKNTILGI